MSVPSENQVATARSYSAVWAKARAASSRRCTRLVPPARTASMTAGYDDGDTTIATLA